MKLSRLLLSAAALLGAFLHPSVSAKSPDRGAADAVTVRLDVDRTVLPADTTEKAVVKISLDGVRHRRAGKRPPVNLAIVIDRSGSMSGDKIVKAREAAIEAVERLSPDDIVSLVVYDNQVDTLIPAQRVGDGSRLIQAIRRIEPRGGTALYNGVVRGADEVRKNLEDRGFVNRVILLSDGLANQGPSTPEELGRLGGTLMRDGISVTTIGLGLGFNEDLMTRLAQRSDGNTYFVEHSSDLSRIFAAELGDVMNVVARRVVIEIEFPAGVRPLNFVGREGTIKGQRAELSLNQIYGGQEKFALIEVEVAPNKADRQIELATARVNYEDTLQKREASATAKRTVQFSSSQPKVIASANHQLQADYAANVLAVAKDQAIDLVDANRRDEAAKLLNDRAASLSATANTYSNKAMLSVAAPAAAAASKIEAEGISNSERKLFRAENMQIRQQQETTNSSTSGQGK